METVADYFWVSKITADSDCSHEIKRHLLLGRKVMTNLDSILKSIDITLQTKGHLIKAMAFPVVMYGCKSWTIKKAEHWRTDAFELWCWKRLLRVPWTARRSRSHVRMWELDHKESWAPKNWCFWTVVLGRSSQFILKEISPEYSLEGLMLKLKLKYFGQLMRRADSFEKTLTLGKIEGRRRSGWQRMRWLDGVTDSMDWCAVHGVTKSTAWLSDWTELNFKDF